MSEYRLVMKGVVKTFPGVKALDHAQLELRPGKVMALMGENGAGNSATTRTAPRSSWCCAVVYRPLWFR